MSSSGSSIENWLQLPVLRLLVNISDQGSLSAAARTVGMAQSNATRALKILERRLGYTLITRSTRGSKLTPEGVLTVEWAREVLEGVEKLSAGAAALAGSGETELVLGASMTIAEYLAPTWIRAMSYQKPNVRTRLGIMNSRQVIDAVSAGDVALGYIETPETPKDLCSVEVWTDRLVVVTDREHSWAREARTLELTELAATPLVEREEGSGTRAFLDNTVGEHRARPVVELNSNSAIRQSVIAGLGPAVLSRLAVEGALRAGRLVEIPTSGEPLIRELKAIWTYARELSEAALTFIEISKLGPGNRGIETETIA